MVYEPITLSLWKYCNIFAYVDIICLICSEEGIRTQYHILYYQFVFDADSIIFYCTIV